MKYFEVHYIIKGQKNKKVFQAKDRVNALATAKSKNLGIIVKVCETSTPIKEHFKSVSDQFTSLAFKQKIKMPDLIVAIRQLSVMTSAGISIHNSIKEVAKATTNKYLKSIFEKIDDDLNIGNSLTKSISSYQNVLGKITIAMVELGENTGNMGDSLAKLADIQEEIWDNKQKFKKAIRYPMTVIVAIIAAFTILMVYAVPKFKSIFDKFKTELPLPTKILLGIEHALSNYGVYILIGLVAMIIFIRFMYETNTNIKNFFDKYIFKIYLIGDIIFYSSMSRFQLIFTELIHAGIPITNALDTSVLTISNSHLKKKLSNIKLSVQRGISLTESFNETKLYEGLLIQMINAGEQSGNLDVMLEKVTDYFKSKFTNILENITSYIEPILIGFIALMVLLMALGIFMPMWDLAKAVKI